MTEPTTLAPPPLPTAHPRRPVDYRILPGVDGVEAILALPIAPEIEQVHAALSGLKDLGWVVSVESYSRIRGPHHLFGLTRVRPEGGRLLGTAQPSR